MFSIETPVDGQPASAGNGVHIAFQASDRAMVKRFHELALANGGTSDGEPGTRPNYMRTITLLSCVTPTAASWKQ